MDIRHAVAQHLAAIGGWAIGQGTAVASKMYDTAVGPKEAQIYLMRGTARFTLTGQYYSEGRNALEAVMVLIEPTIGDEQLREMVEQFAGKVDAAVAATYAARLLGLGVRAHVLSWGVPATSCATA